MPARSSILLLFACCLAYSQIRSGTIVGSVTDPSSSPVPNASVNVVAEETNFSYSTATNASGEYTVPYLPFGRYSVTVAKQGFQSARVTAISVSTAQTVRADVRLELSSVATTVDVIGGAAELQTESASVQNAIQERLIQAVPNVTHNPF